MPDPLHPAVVHFPIALITLGAAVALLAAVWHQRTLSLVVSLLLLLGAGGGWLSLETGEDAEHAARNLSKAAKAELHEHEEWAERTFALALAAGLLGAGATLVHKRSAGLARGATVLTALAACAAGYAVYETGHHGGALVYKHGVGVGTPAATTTTAASHDD